MSATATAVKAGPTLGPWRARRQSSGVGYQVVPHTVRADADREVVCHLVRRVADARLIAAAPALLAAAEQALSAFTWCDSDRDEQQIDAAIAALRAAIAQARGE